MPAKAKPEKDSDAHHVPTLHELWASTKGHLQHIQDETAETLVYSVLKQAVGTYFNVTRSTVDFQLSAGIVDFKELNFLPAAREMVTKSLHEAGLPLKLTMLQIGGVHIENFYTSDLLDGDIDHALSITVS